MTRPALSPYPWEARIAYPPELRMSVSPRHSLRDDSATFSPLSCRSSKRRLESRAYRTTCGGPSAIPTPTQRRRQHDAHPKRSGAKIRTIVQHKRSSTTSPLDNVKLSERCRNGFFKLGGAERTPRSLNGMRNRPKSFTPSNGRLSGPASRNSLNHVRDAPPSTRPLTSRR